jgi:hypothetical protein
MAVAATRVNIGTSAGVLASNPASSAEGDFRTVRVLLKNATGTAPVFVGGSGLTAANGFQWDVADGPLALVLEPGESISGIVASVTQAIHVIIEGR